MGIKTWVSSILFFSSILIISGCNDDDYFSEELTYTGVYKGQTATGHLFSVESIELVIPGVLGFKSSDISLKTNGDECDYIWSDYIVPKCDYHFIEVLENSEYEFTPGTELTLSMDENWLEVYEVLPLQNEEDNTLVKFDYNDLIIGRYEYVEDGNYWRIVEYKSNVTLQDGRVYVHAEIQKAGAYVIAISKDKTDFNYIGGEIRLFNENNEEKNYSISTSKFYNYNHTTPVTGKNTTTYYFEDTEIECFYKFPDIDQYLLGVENTIQMNANNFFSVTIEGEDLTIQDGSDFSIKVLDRDESSLSFEIAAYLINDNLDEYFIYAEFISQY